MKFLFLAILLAFCGPEKTKHQSWYEVNPDPVHPTVEEAPQLVSPPPTTATEKEELSDYVARIMQISNASLTDLERLVLIRNIVNISFEIFVDQRHREAFVFLIGKESNFDVKAQNKNTQATGLTQVLPKYASEFAARCNIPYTAKDNLFQQQVNLLIGACQFRYLIDKFGGNLGISLAAYNAGAHSAAVRQMSSWREMNKETGSYVAIFAYITEEMRLERERKNQNTETETQQ